MSTTAIASNDGTFTPAGEHNLDYDFRPAKSDILVPVFVDARPGIALLSATGRAVTQGCSRSPPGSPLA